jgi:hypothetical protein
VRGCVKKNRNAEKWYALAKGGKVKCRLHPLIHTSLKFTLAQNIENRQAIVGIKKPPLTRTASKGFRAARIEHTPPLTFLEYQAIEKEKA